jgi:hypothetical protein
LLADPLQSSEGPVFEAIRRPAYCIESVPATRYAVWHKRRNQGLMRETFQSNRNQIDNSLERLKGESAMWEGCHAA